MRSVLAMAAAVVLTPILPHVTFAQGNQPRSQQPSQPVREQVKQTLEAAGFTDVQVMPESFLVRAKDPAGSPVIMVIDPDSFTAFSEPQNQQSNGSLQPSSSVSTTMSQGQQPNQTVDNEKIPGEANVFLAELKEDSKPSLTVAEKQEIWQSLSSVKTARANEPKDFTPQVGAIIPNGVSVQPLPDDITNNAPSLKGYHYAMLQNEIVIVNPTSKRIVDIIKEQ
jgi:hypothetical protein